MQKSFRRWIWLGGSVVVLGLVVNYLSTSPEWHAFRWDRLWSSIIHARPGYLLAAVAATLSSYLLRAYRWQFFLDPIKKASLWVLFAGQILGFSSIYLVGRPGEFVRPAYIARKENVPFTSMAAVWLLERIYDAVFLVILFAAALYLAPLAPAAGQADINLKRMHDAGRLMFLVTPVLCAALVFFRLRAEKTIAWASRVFRFLPGRGPHHLEHFLRSFADGLKVIQNAKDFVASVVVSVALWLVNGSVFWLTFQSLGGGLEKLSWLSAALAMFFSVMGLAVQLPGVGGGYQLGAIIALTKIFSVGVEAATGAAILIWVLISGPCLAIGAVLLLHEGLSFRKLEAMAEEQEHAAAADEL
jgi:uncharacterized protein (TIRG00374 family)